MDAKKSDIHFVAISFSFLPLSFLRVYCIQHMGTHEESSACTGVWVRKLEMDANMTENVA